MRIAVIYFSKIKQNKLEETAQALCRGFEESGNSVTLINGNYDINTNLTMFEFLALGTNSEISLYSKKKEILSFFNQAGILMGKRGFLFFRKRTLPLRFFKSEIITRFIREGLNLEKNRFFPNKQCAYEAGLFYLGASV